MDVKSDLVGKQFNRTTEEDLNCESLVACFRRGPSNVLGFLLRSLEYSKAKVNKLDLSNQLSKISKRRKFVLEDLETQKKIIKSAFA